MKGSDSAMFRFSREKILPLFLQAQLSIRQLAVVAGISWTTAFKAVNGLRVSSKVVDKICKALRIDDATAFLVTA